MQVKPKYISQKFKEEGMKTMKTMKRLFTIALAIMMVMSLATTAFAAETEGTIVNGTSRTYKAYQIFSGTQASGSAVLGDIAWGSGINSTDFLAALKTLKVGNATPFASCATADDVANVLKDEANNSDVAKAFANLAENYVTGSGTSIGSKKTVTVPSGYYIVIDQTAVDGQNKVRNAALLQVTNGSSMKITEKNECKERSIDLCETFNYLIGLTVNSQSAISYYLSKPAENPAYEGAVDLVSDLSGQYAFRQIEGTLPDGRRALVIWRTVTEDVIASNAALDAYFTTYRKNAQDRKYDVIFVNGDSNLENLRRSNEGWTVQMTEIEFKKRMFEEV